MERLLFLRKMSGVNGLIRGLVAGVIMMVTANAVRADMPSPSEYEIGMDFETKQAEFILYTEDKPGFGIDNPLGGGGGSSSNINFNVSFIRGTTRMKVQFRLLPDPDVNLVPQVRVRFHYWPDGYGLVAFQKTPYGYATDLTFTLALDEDGKERIDIREDIQGQEYLTARKVRHVSGKLQSGEWITYELELTSRFDLPERKWLTGQQLQKDNKTKKAVIEAFRRVYQVLSQKDADKSYRLYEPQMKNDGASYGIDPREWFDDQATDLISQDYEYRDFDVSESELRIFGYGRLATLFPSPIVTESEKYKDYFAPSLYFWKDSSGKWHLRD